MDRKYQIELLRRVGKWEHGKQDKNVNWKLEFKALLSSIEESKVMKSGGLEKTLSFVRKKLAPAKEYY